MIALYPGAFKPPHRGHFEVVKSLLNGTHNGQVYTKDNYKDAGSSSLSGKKSIVDKINKVIVFPGGGERNGITKGESIAIWKIYSKYLPGIEVMDGEKNPMFAAKDYAKANTNDNFYAITGIRSEEDLIDLRRITTFTNTPHVQGLVIPAAKGNNVRASQLRQAALSGNLDELRDFFPSQLNREELLSILKMLKDNIISEIMNEKMENLFEEMFTSEAPFSKSVTEKSEVPKYTKYMASVLEYMIDEGMKVTPLPEIKINRDEANASNFFGKTAYYDPNVKEIVLFVEGRHPKDIVRSFVHEMIHHMQNLEGRLGNIGTTNTNEDDDLLEIEKEAYLKGNITFRNWEDNYKNKKKVMAEGRYDKISNQVSSDLFKSLKNGETSFYKNYETDDLDFNVFGDFIPTGSVEYFAVDGDADYDETGEQNDSIRVIVSYNPKEVPDAFKDIAFTLKDIVRHEIEHLTHSDSDNLKSGKYMDDDSLVRALVKTGALPKGDYFKLAKEVDANIQGMYFRAKKEKRPFADVVKQYFDDQNLPKDDYENILNLMRKRLPALGIKQRL
tara:strand:+ start:221 stop:1894 length:1674 start_codon:yes stop_codon:yes gene_type:complete